jgi:hypothetical protein
LLNPKDADKKRRAVEDESKTNIKVSFAAEVAALRLLF